MGNNFAKSEGDGAGATSQGYYLHEKFELARKSGVLNLSDINIEVNSFLWNSLSDSDMRHHIKVLDLSKNSIRLVPNGVLHLHRLQAFYASFCDLQMLPSFANLSFIQVMKLDNNDLEDNSTGDFPSSTVDLDISSNHFSSFPTALTGLRYLEILNLNCNRIHCIEGIGGLVSLKILLLNDNNLTELPTEISSLRNLKEISLKRNKILKHTKHTNKQSIPSELFISTSVTSIALEGNTNLLTTDLLSFDGIDIFLIRRQKYSDFVQIKDDRSIFGLD
eukprot:gene2356-4572_t